MGAGREIQAPAAVPGANDHLKLVSADLLEQGSFDQAVEGCDGVFHTASLFFTKNVTDPQVSHYYINAFFSNFATIQISGSHLLVHKEDIADIFIKAANCFQIQLLHDCHWEYKDRLGAWGGLGLSSNRKGAT
jgi:hypothetical protein